MELYLLIEGQQQGPFTEEMTRESLAEGLIPDDLPAWKEGLDDWVPVMSLLPPVPQPVGAESLSHHPNEPHLDSPEPESLKTFPWYRSAAILAPLIFVPPMLGSAVALWLKPLSILGLMLAVAGPIYYKSKGQTEVMPRWTRFLALTLLVYSIPSYFALWLDRPATGINPSDSQVAHTAILTVMRQERQLEQEYHAQRTKIVGEGDEPLDEVSQLAGQLAGCMRSIDLSKCPPDFQEACARNASAWSDYSQVVAEHPHIRSSDEALAEGFMRGLAGDITGGAYEAQDELNSFLSRSNQSNDEIQRSWENVTAIALKYHVPPAEYPAN